MRPARVADKMELTARLDDGQDAFVSPGKLPCAALVMCPAKMFSDSVV